MTGRRRVMVTGATGFVGRNCLRPLVDLGYEVHAYARHPGDPSPGVVWHAADLLSTGTAKAIIDTVKPSHLLHCAWFAKPGEFWESSLNLAWLSASLDLFKEFGDAGGECLVGVGSCAEYGPVETACEERRTPCHPDTVYGLAKLAAGQGLLACGAVGGFAVSWMRVFAPYGPAEPKQKFISSIISKTLEGHVIECGDLSKARDFIFVRDVAEGLVKALDANLQGVYNLCTGRPVTLGEVVETVARVMRQAPDIVEKNTMARGGDPQLVLGDPRALQQALSWSPPTTLTQGLAETVDRMREASPSS